MEVNSKKLYLAMAKAGLNQSGLAAKADVSSRTIAAILNGRKCRADVLGRLSKALEVEPQDLVE